MLFHSQVVCSFGPLRNRWIAFLLGVLRISWFVPDKICDCKDFKGTWMRIISSDFSERNMAVAACECSFYCAMICGVLCLRNPFLQCIIS